MIKELMHDPIFLAGKSEAATKDDLQVLCDLQILFRCVLRLSCKEDGIVH